MIATRRKIDHSDSNSFDSTLYVCTQLLLYLGCWQQPCKCRICQGIHLSFARPASTLTSPVTYCDVCIYIPVGSNLNGDVFMTQSDATIQSFHKLSRLANIFAKLSFASRHLDGIFTVFSYFHTCSFGSFWATESQKFQAALGRT